MPDIKKTILAIDDDISILNIIRAVLEKTYDVSLAKNTDIAITILNSAKVDLILLDMNMPGINGMDFLRYLRNDNSHYHIPVIIVSAQGTADTIVEVKKMGAADFVVKPISPAILLEKIRANLNAAKIIIGREALKRKLERLAASCAAGKGNSVEEVIKDLEDVYFEREIDTELEKICKYVKDMEYNLVEERANQLLMELSV
jgi:putative two-component system response regulator